MISSNSAIVSSVGEFGLVENARDHLRGAVGFDDVRAAVGFDGDLLFEDEAAIDAPDAAAVQRAIENRRGVPIGIAARRNGVTDGDGREWAEFFDDFAAALFGLRRLGHVGARRQRVRGNIFEISLREGEAFGRFHVADDQEDGIVGRVVSVEEGLHVGERGGIEVGKVTVEIVGVGPIAKSDWRKIEPGKTAVGLVHHVDADFFFHHVALIAQIFVVYFQSAHAIGFEPQNAFERVGGDGLEIIGDVVVGGAVEHAAGGIDEADVFHFSGVFGTLEHHVLEKMGEAAAAARLEAKADLIINADGDDGRGAVWRDDHAQAVGERGVFDGNVQILHFGFLLEFLSARASCCSFLAGFLARTLADRRTSVA